MKFTPALLLSLTFSAATHAEEQSAKKTRRTVPSPYPAIIQINPAGDAGQAAPAGIIQSELGGREMQFFQNATQAGQDLLALTDLAKSKGGSEQIKAIAEMLGTTQATESKEVARLAAAKKAPLARVAATAAVGDLAALSGAKFEKAWIERLIAVNESGLAAYEGGAKAADPDVRSFAEKMWPVAKARLEMAQRLGGKSAQPPTAPAPSAKPAPPVARGGGAQPIPPPIATPVPATPARP
jgi:hypothetical protein